MDSRHARPLLVIALGLLLIPALVLSPGTGGIPLLFIHGAPDAKIQPPNVHTYVSVIDRETGRVIEGLDSSHFVVEETASLLPNVTVSYEPVGLAAAIVVDRGGISKRGDSRIKAVVDLLRVFLDRIFFSDGVDQNFSWSLLVILALAFALVVFVLLLIRTRGALANKVIQGATGFLKDVTRPLSAASRCAAAKLVIQRGANVGREYALSAQVTKVGRDVQFADFALQDEYISNPHFSIYREGTQFYIMDEGSTNGTLLNGMVLQPRQRVPLAPDTIIELGQTWLQFKQLGLATQSLAAVPGNRGGQPASTHPFAASPPAAPPNPYTTSALDEPPVEHKPPSNPYLTQKVQDDCTKT